MQQDSRARPRRHLFYYLRVYDATSGHLLGRLVDLTSDAVMLLTTQPLPANSAYRLRLELPREMDPQLDVVLDASSLWCRRDERLDLYRVGFQLLKIARGSRSVVKSMIFKFALAN